MSQGMALVLQSRGLAIEHKDPFVFVCRRVRWLATSHMSDGQPRATPEICQAGLDQYPVVVPGMRNRFLPEELCVVSNSNERCYQTMCC